jgi:hypothetical protein
LIIRQVIAVINARMRKIVPFAFDQIYGCAMMAGQAAPEAE